MNTETNICCDILMCTYTFGDLRPSSHVVGGLVQKTSEARKLTEFPIKTKKTELKEHILGFVCIFLLQLDQIYPNVY